jgi:5-formyltetrahydrofolate cyclo-ligase
MTPNERAAAAHAVARLVLALPGVADARGVLGYVATAEELDPAAVLEELRSRGARIAFPRVAGPTRLALHWVSEGDELSASAFGILEPSEDAPLAEPGVIDVALVPGVAFDEACNRIGYGGCFYDNLLPLLPAGALKVGLAFDAQLVQAVPAEDHDVPLDFVVTPRAVFEAARRE